MKLSNLNDWLSLGANIGVLVGIAIVIYELNQNNIALNTEIAWSHQQATAELFLSLANDKELAAIQAEMDKVEQPDQTRDVQISDAEIVRWTSLMAARANYLQARYLTETSDLERIRLIPSIEYNLGSPSGRFFFSSNRAQTILHPDFVSFVNEVLGLNSGKI